MSRERKILVQSRTWKYGRALDLGFDPKQAALIDEHDLDMELIEVRLVERGCPHDLAIQIAASHDLAMRFAAK